MLTAEDLATDAYFASYSTHDRASSYMYGKPCSAEEYNANDWGTSCPPVEAASEAHAYLPCDSRTPFARHPTHLPPHWSRISLDDEPVPPKIEGLNLTREQTRLLMDLRDTQSKTFSPALDYSELSPPEVDMPLTPAFSTESNGSYFSFHARDSLHMPGPPAPTPHSHPAHLSPKLKESARRSSSNGVPQKRKAQTDHNAIEHRYRDKIRQQLEALKGLLPELRSDDSCEKASKWIVLEHAVSRIKTLQARNEDLQGRNDELAERVQALENIISQLWASQHNSLQ